LSKFENNEWLSAYKAEPQLFPKKYGVKLQKHLKIAQGEQRLLETGKTCEAEQNRKINNVVCDKDADVKLKIKMKKVFLMLVVLIGLGISVNAQSCQIDTDGSEVAVKGKPVFNEDKTAVIVKLNNDHAQQSARVTITIEVIYESKNTTKTETKTYSSDGGDIVSPKKPKTIKIPIDSSIKIKSHNSGDTYTAYPDKVKVTSITGKKCNK
jgi:hypothetical protein